MQDRWPGRALALFLSLAAGTVFAQDDPIDGEEAARLAALKSARAEAILAREEGRGRPFDPGFRAEMKARLTEASAESLDIVDKRGYGLLPEPKALGDNSADLVYTPIAPCRIVDTRPGGSALAAGVARHFRVAGTDGFAAQGGNPAGCGLPLGPATAAVVNFVAVNPSGPGNLRAWAYGGTAPNASIINYAAVGMNIANAVVVPLCDAAAASCAAADLTVQADVSGAHLVADVVGYFRNVVKAQYRSFSVSASRVAVHVDIPVLPCSYVGGTEVTIVAPVAGRIEVQGTAVLTIDHLNGTPDQLANYIGTSPTDCRVNPGEIGLPGLAVIPSALPTVSNWTVTTHARGVFDVAAGSYTYYLTTAQAGGGGNDLFSHGWLTATFHPN